MIWKKKSKILSLNQFIKIFNIFIKKKLSHCLKCSKNPKVAKTKKGRTILSSKCAVCESKILRFVKELGADGFFTCFLGRKSPFH